MTSTLSLPWNRMDDIVLKPHLSCGIRWQDQKTGVCSKEKSFHFSTTTTLLKMMLFLLSLCVAIKGMLWLCNLRKSFKMRKKYRMKLGKMKTKMTKS
ncbi:MAG: hypothetical protein IKT50_04495 [Clostridia bacterium]|nr:hypothetical protein [Clostridia bacterium]